MSVRISPHGVTAFQYRYRWQRKPVRLTIGKYPAMSLKDARIIVGQMRELYTKGLNPKIYFSEEVSEATLQYWLDKYVSTLRSNTQMLYKSVLYNSMHTEFKSVPISNISISSWVSFFDKQEKANPKKARVLLVQLKSMLNWCMSRQFIASCEAMKLSSNSVDKGANAGSRVLTYYELAKIWTALEKSKIVSSNKILHQLILLYGCRLS